MGFDSFSQTTAIPDDKFEQALIDLKIDTNGKNNTILNSDAVAVDSLIIEFRGIANLSGIEAFTSLTYLNCWLNQLTSLDVSSNTDLTELRCNENQLTSLNASKNTALAILDCSANQLTTLNISSNTDLTELRCNSNELTSLNVSTNTALTELFCGSNELTSLDISSNTALTELTCGNNSLTSLDVSANKKLTRLLCTRNQLTSLNLKNGNNTSLRLNVTNNPNLSCIQVDDASNIPNLWTKDATAVYNEDCSALSNKDFELSGISILPNPTSGVLNITTIEKANYSLFNIKGQVLKKGVLENKIDISSLSKGIYLLNIKTSKDSFTKKVVRN